MAKQLALDLPHVRSFGRDDFLVTQSNAAAVELIDNWPNWPAYAVILTGLAGSGKSHLVEVWRQRSGASVIQAGRLSIDGIPELLEAKSAAIEDADIIQPDERAFFHLLNLAKQQGASLLITAQARPEHWKITLPDLASRLRALPVVEILPPDDALLRAVLVKHFHDRQVSADENTISYLLTRMPRSLAAARSYVAHIDRLALEQRADVTRPFVARVLAEISEPGLFDEND
jgi:chromosomal replication initiation ATPase DnaA